MPLSCGGMTDFQLPVAANHERGVLWRVNARLIGEMRDKIAIATR
jgi:hypothetical protein